MKKQKIRVSLKDIVRELTPEESQLEIWKATEMKLMGIKMYLDTPGINHNSYNDIEDLFKSGIITEFKSSLEYSMALSKAEILIIDGKPVPEPLRSKLISVKKKLDEKGLTVPV